MPNMKNAIKKVKQTKKVTEANRHINSTVKNAIKNLISNGEYEENIWKY